MKRTNPETSITRADTNGWRLQKEEEEEGMAGGE